MGRSPGASSRLRERWLDRDNPLRPARARKRGESSEIHARYALLAALAAPPPRTAPTKPDQRMGSECAEHARKPTSSATQACFPPKRSELVVRAGPVTASGRAR